MNDLRSQPIEELLAEHERIALELARRAGAALRPRQLSLLEGFGPIDPDAVDLDEKLSDGSRRWLTPKEAAPIMHCDDDTVRRRAIQEDLGIQRRGKYYIDRLRIKIRI